MKLMFEESAWQDYVWWQHTDKVLFKRINQLIQECLRTPYTGIGKPEPLKHMLQGFWSRRINQEHRLVYTVQSDCLIITACRYHY
jgi:toxin YoeB